MNIGIFFKVNVSGSNKSQNNYSRVFLNKDKRKTNRLNNPPVLKVAYVLIRLPEQNRADMSEPVRFSQYKILSTEKNTGETAY
jgi:hypothetical protein